MKSFHYRHALWFLMASSLIMTPAIMTPAMADVIVMKNGDRITGTIKSASDGKMTITPNFDKSSPITVTQSEIASFSTTHPLKIKLKNGTLITLPVALAPPGQVLVMARGVPPRPLPINDIAKINPGPAWSGSLSVNGAYNDAGTSSKSIGASVTAIKLTDIDRITLKADYNYGDQNDEGVRSETANNWSASAKYDYFVSKQWYAYGIVPARANHINFLRLELEPGAGGGYQWINDADFHFSTEAGFSWVYTDYATAPGVTQNLAGRVAYSIDKSWGNGRIKVFHTLAFLPPLEGSNDYLIQGEAGVRTTIVGNLFSELKADVNYNSQPGADARETTTQISLGIGMTF